MPSQTFNTIQDFSSAIAGKWSNPLTQTQFCFNFSPKKLPEGTLGVVQHRSKEAITLNISIKLRGGEPVLTVENSHYEVSMMGSYVKSLFIIMPHGVVLQLVRKD